MLKRLRRWSDRGVLLVGLGTCAGLGMVVAGWVMQGYEYVPNLLLQVGSSLLLVIPLVVLNRTLETRLKRTERSIIDVDSQVRENSARLDELSEASRDRWHNERAMVAQLLNDVLGRSSYQNVVALLKYAWELGALARDGFRIRIGEESIRLEIRPVDELVSGLSVAIVTADGTPTATLTWRQSDRSLDILEKKIVSAVRGMSAEFARFSLRQVPLLPALLKTVRIVMDAKTGVTRDLGTVIEVVNDDWVIAADGLRYRNDYYLVRKDALLGKQQDWVNYMSRKSWVDKANFVEAHDVAVSLYARRAQPADGAGPAGRRAAGS